MLKPSLKDSVAAYIADSAKRYGLRSVILFGSRARGTNTEKSDIDLAIEGDDIHCFIADIEERCPTLLQFDFIDLGDDISEELRDRIRKEGVVLYEQIR